MNKIVALIISITISTIVCAQLPPKTQKIVDSLYNEVKTSEYDTTIANAYVNLSESLYIISVDTLIPLCETAQKICEKNLKRKDLTPQEIRSFKYSLAAAINNIGFVHGQHGNSSLERNFYLRSLEIKEEINDEEGVAIALNNIGATHRKQGNLTKAIEYYDRSLKIKDKLGEKRGVSLTLSNIGVIYEGQNEIDKALEYYNKALEIQNEIGEERLKAISLNNIALVLFKRKDFEKSLEHNFESLNIRKSIGDKKGIANSLHNIALVYKNQDKYDEALQYYHESLVIKEEQNDKDGIPPTLSEIGFVHFIKGNNQKAKKITLKALKVAEESENPYNVKIASHLLEKIYKKERNYKAAYAMSELYYTMRDSLQNEKIRKTALKQNMQYEYDKKAAADSVAFAKEKEIKEIEIAKQKAEIKAKRNQQYALYGGLALVLIFAGFIFNRFKITQKQKQVIEEQKYLVEEKNQEITDSIHYAKRIQAAILPPDKTIKEHLPDSFIIYKPKDIVAGDFYWMEPISSLEGGLKVGDYHPSNSHFGKLSAGSQRESIILFAAADCTGHGVPGAMVSVVCNNGLNRSVREHGLNEPGKILDKTREIIIQEFEKSEDEVKDGMDIALCSLQQMADSYQLKYAGAHNPLWIVRKSDGLKVESDKGEVKEHVFSNFDFTLYELKANKQPIGKFINPQPYTTHTIKLQKGDTIYIFTDGYVDQFGGDKGKKLKAKAFRDLLLSIQSQSMNQQKEIINDSFEKWKGDLEQIDDVCIIGVRV